MTETVHIDGNEHYPVWEISESGDTPWGSLEVDSETLARWHHGFAAWDALQKEIGEALDARDAKKV